MKTKKDTRNLRRLARARARMIIHGTTLSQWARLHGYSPSTVHRALTAERGGEISLKIITEVFTSDIRS